MTQPQKIVILDFGGQYTQLIARRVRECHVYSEVLPYHASMAAIRAQEPVGIILSGGPASVLQEDAPRCDPGIYDLGIPVLGICYGMQLTAHLLGGQVERAAQREYGRIQVTMADKASLRHVRRFRRLDEPHLSGKGLSRGLPPHCAHGKLPCCRHGG